MSTALKTALAVGVPILIIGLTELVAWDGGYFPLYYVVPLALVVPWAIILRFAEGPPGHRLLAFDAIVMILAGLRIVGPFLPMSGHVLFLVYTGLTIRNHWYRLAGTVVLAESTYLKFFVWHEAGSWAAGLGLGLLLGLLGPRRVGRPVSAVDPG